MRGYLTGLALVCLLAACANSHAPINLNLAYWSFNGKLSIQGGGRSRVVNIDWHQQGDSTNIYLNGPLGIGYTHIRTMGNLLVINTGGNAQSYPLDQDLVIEADSFRLPWTHLTYWVQGLQGSNMKPIEGALLQDNWSVTILDADNTGPILIDLHHPKVRIRLKVRSWQRGKVK